MLPDWDADSSQLRKNLFQLFESIEVESGKRRVPTIESARLWQREIMRNLHVPDAQYVGAFRGESGLEDCQVHVGERWGVSADRVASALSIFERRLQQATAFLDRLIPVGVNPNVDQGAAVVELCAWAHAEWVRIHPFANGNGRTARLWANSIAMRYGLPPFLQLRPRPTGVYGAVCEQAMLGNWLPAIEHFRDLLEEFRKEIHANLRPP
jgi:fido (protein-threonine AMPylation protein)